MVFHISGRGSGDVKTLILNSFEQGHYVADLNNLQVSNSSLGNLNIVFIPNMPKMISYNVIVYSNHNKKIKNTYSDKKLENIKIGVPVYNPSFLGLTGGWNKSLGYYIRNNKKDSYSHDELIKFDYNSKDIVKDMKEKYNYPELIKK